MHTPNELRDIQFTKAVFGGYDTSSVDELMNSIISDYTALFKENTVLKNKLKLLADTVEEYRSVDEAMRKALITAQNMANEMVKEAEEKSKDMLEKARIKANAQLESLTARVRQEQKRLREAKRDTAGFIAEVMKMFERQGRLLIQLNEKLNTEDEEPEDEIAADGLINEEAVAEKVTADNAAVPDTAEMLIKRIEKEIEEKSVTELGGDDNEHDIIPEPPVKSGNKTDIDAGDTTDFIDKTTRRFDFSELKFGKDYDISKD
ncbi:MAG: DivIVA domain-containing protein [Clostridiales bacterium]|jgi:cell division initiation protein|nr:DivIVA domain-containing protein [Clostridiales bacterium]